MKLNYPLKIGLLFIVFLEHRADEWDILILCSEKDVSSNQWCSWQNLRIHLLRQCRQIPPLLVPLRSHNSIQSLFEPEGGLKGVCFLTQSLHIMAKRRSQWPNSRQISVTLSLSLNANTKQRFFSVVMYECESWTIKKAKHGRIDAFKFWCWRRLLRVPWTARRSNQSVLKEINAEYSLKDWCCSWSSNTLATWCEELTH